jgi:hypothetical protein
MKNVITRLFTYLVLFNNKRMKFKKKNHTNMFEFVNDSYFNKELRINWKNIK